MKRLLTAIAVILILLNSLLFFIGCQKSDTKTESEIQKVTVNTVTIKNFGFGPQNLELKPGDEVTWVNGDSTPHAVVADSLFDSGAIQPGSTFNYRFQNPGVYEYKCTIHPKMVGTITVK